MLELISSNPELILSALVIMIAGAVVLSRRTKQEDKKAITELLIKSVIRSKSEKPEEKN